VKARKLQQENVTPESDVAPVSRFTGKEEEDDVEIGLQYFGKRYLSPYLGRWISPDPLAVHAPGKADLNLYAYVSGRVLQNVDPLGLDPTDGERQYRYWSQAWADEKNIANQQKKALEANSVTTRATGKNYATSKRGTAMLLVQSTKPLPIAMTAPLSTRANANVHGWLLTRVDTLHMTVTQREIDAAAQWLAKKDEIVQALLGAAVSTRAAPAETAAKPPERAAPDAAPAEAPTLRMGNSVGADVERIRVRRFTRASSLKPIEESNMIKASDQNSVFTVRAKGKPGSPRDVEKDLGIKKGKGGAYVEFDARPSEFDVVENPKTGARELVFRGNVDLTGRNATFQVNR